MGYLHAKESESESTPLVFFCENSWRPLRSWWRRWPIIPCYLDEWTKEDKNQEFFYEETGKTIHDGQREWKLCHQGGLMGLCDYGSITSWTSRWFTITATEWSYESEYQTLETTKWGTKYLA